LIIITIGSSTVVSTAKTAGLLHAYQTAEVTVECSEVATTALNVGCSEVRMAEIFKRFSSSE
jgi:molybdenum cofactor biosynthesis enzyme